MNKKIADMFCRRSRNRRNRRELAMRLKEIDKQDRQSAKEHKQKISLLHFDGYQINHLFDRKERG
jgi:hypothetical protein